MEITCDGSDGLKHWKLLWHMEMSMSLTGKGIATWAMMNIKGNLQRKRPKDGASKYKSIEINTPPQCPEWKWNRCLQGNEDGQTCPGAGL